MASGATGAVLRHLERLFASGTVSGLSEGQLLERFVTRRDEAAFEALVSRHGPMVLGVCRRLLRDPNDVDDAFQATFLVLVRKAGSLRRREQVGNWLYGVAHRVAARSRAIAARRAATESPGDGPDAPAPEPTAPWPELHEEIHRLPESYRTAVVLCYLEGLTHEEAADRLGWPLGTVKGRLSRARDLLRSRLTRRGLTLASAAAVADRLALEAPAAVPATLIEPTIRAAALVAAGRLTAAGRISARVVVLSEGVLHAMTLSKLKTAALSMTLAGTVLTGAGVLAYQGNAGDGPTQPAARQSSPGARGGSQDATPEGKSEVKTADVTKGDTSRLEDLKQARYEQRSVVQDLRQVVQSLQETQSDHNTLKLEYARRDLQRAETVLEWIELSLHASRVGNLAPAGNPGAGDPPPPPPPPQPASAPILSPAAPPQVLPALPNPGRGPAFGAGFGMGGGGMGGAMMGGGGMGGAMMGGGMGGRVEPPLDSERQMRVLIADLANQVASQDGSPRTREILKKLDEPISFSFAKPTPLEDVLKYIKSATQGSKDMGIPIYVDPDALNAHIKTRFEGPDGPAKGGGGAFVYDPTKVSAEDRQRYTSVTLDLEGVPLRASLRLLLKQLDLAYCVKDGFLLISSVEGVYLELKEFESAQQGEKDRKADSKE